MSKTYERIRDIDMKSYNHLYEKFIAEDNIRLAIINGSKGKRNRRKINRALKNIDAYVPKIKMFAERFKSPMHHPVVIKDGHRKTREIVVPTMYELFIHHMLMNVLKPILSKGFYYHSYGSIPKKGRYRAKMALEKEVRKGYRYCLQMDIRKFYENISHEILMSKLAQVIHDEKMLEIIGEVLNATDRGLPLGFYTSQWFANFYLTKLDHFIKQNLKAPFYIRYMDDMIILSNNKRKLHRYRRKISSELEELGLELKPNYQIYKIDEKNSIGYLGFRFYRNRTTLDKRLLYRITRKARKIGRKRKITAYDARQFIGQLCSLKKVDCYETYRKWIKPYVTKKELTPIISKYDKEVTRCIKK